MKEEMGIHHSSLSCERLSLSIQNCFGCIPKRPYQADAGKPSRFSNSSLSNGASLNGSTNHSFVDSSHPEFNSTQGKCGLGKSCCCKGTDQDNDGFAYNICSQSVDSQANPAGTMQTVSSSSSNLPPTVSRQSSTCSRDSSSHMTKSSAEIICERKTSSNSIPGLDNEPKRTTVLANCNGSYIKTIVNSSSSTAETVRKSSLADEDNIQSTVMKRDTQQRTSSFKVHKSISNKLSQSEEQVDNSKSRTLTTEDVSEVALSTEKPQADIQYFRNLVITETKRLRQSIENWDSVLEDENSTCPLEVSGEIRTVIGQTRLVISERFAQFSKLIDQAEGKNQDPNGGLPVLLSDLQGFWDMIYFQVQDVDAKFDGLEKLKSNEWKSIKQKKKVEAKPVKKSKGSQPAKKRPAKKKAPPSDEEKKRREAARRRLAEARKALAKRNQSEPETTSPSSPSESPENPSLDTDYCTSKHPNDDASENIIRKRPDSLVDAITCAVAVGQVNAETSSLSSISSTSLVH